jgi:hypothetical protein
VKRESGKYITAASLQALIRSGWVEIAGESHTDFIRTVNFKREAVPSAQLAGPSTAAK